MCAISIKTSGYVELEIGIERSKETLTHKFLVLDSPERTIILGRDFLIRFKSTEFDWNEGRIRLGEIWLSTEASVWGGQVLSIAEMVKYMFVEHNENTSCNGWNISPNLDLTQQRELIKLLEEYSDIFASNPKKPNNTHLMLHVIETGDSLPVKSKNIRVSPQTVQEINSQISQMLQNGIVRPSASPWAC